MRIMKLAAVSLLMTLATVATAAAQAAPPDADLIGTVPEPTTLVFLATGIGVGAVALFRRRK